MSEIKFDGFQEIKEKPKRLVIEIGAKEANSYLKKYNVQLPPDTDYRIVNVRYGLYPYEPDESQPIPLTDNSVDEVVISNLLSDMVALDILDKKKMRELWQYFEDSGNDGFDPKNDTVAYFQKIRTLKDIIRVLKPGGFLRIYENYRQFHPVTVNKILFYLAQHPGLEVVEDVDEEERIKTILKSENQKAFDFERKTPSIYSVEEFKPPHRHNKVYRIRKKPPQ